MSENELRPCPFCGCTDNFITVTSNPFSNDIYSTTHCKCYATGPFIAENYLTGEKVPTRESMEDKATERWNTRPIEDDLRKRIAELEEKQRWRVVANGELPEDGEVVWLWDGKYIGMGYYLVFAGQFMDRDTPLRPIRPSHWMRFPEPPKVQE